MNSRYRRDILRAVACAERLAKAPKSTPATVQDFRPERLVGYEALADSAICPMNIGLKPDDPTCVYIDSLDEFPDLYATLTEMADGPIDADGNAVKKHEVQHDIALEEIQENLDLSAIPEARDAQVNMIKGIKFTAAYVEGVLRTKVNPYVSPANLWLPKLALAALSTYPEADGGPSGNDIAHVQRLGYTGVQEVGRRIEAWNEAPPSWAGSLPLPLTYTPTE